MKIKVRTGVFETNSSSTHSLEISSISIEDATENVYKRIQEAYKNAYEYSGYTDESDYFSNGVLYLRGIDMESGDEDKNIYYIVSTWMSKLQYLAMFIENNAYYFDDFDRVAYKNSYSNTYNSYHDETYKLTLNTAVYKRFVELCKDFMKTKGYDVKDVNYDIRYTSYFENLKIDNNNETIYMQRDKHISVEDIEDLFNKVMDEKYILTYADEAYSPYYKPEVHII